MKYLIKDTTKEEREKIVLDALEYSDVSCGNGSGYDFYLPYINGEKELSQLNMEYHTSYASAMLDRGQSKGGCGQY